MHHPVVERLREKRMADIGLVVLRVVVGCAFIYHGYMKLNGLSSAVFFFRQLGIPLAGFVAPTVSVLEIIGGVLLILGLAVRAAGAVFVIDMAMAILLGMKFRSTWDAHELEALLLASGLMFLFVGAGPFSFDAWLMEKFRKEHQDALPVTKR